MAYNSAHTGPEIDAAVQLLGEIQEAKNSTASDRQAVAGMAATVAAQAAQVSSQAGSVSSNTAVVLASASAVESDRAEVEQNTALALSAKEAVEDARSEVLAAKEVVEIIQSAVSNAQVAVDLSEQSAGDSASSARSDREIVEALAIQTADDRTSAAESAAAAAAVVTGGTATLQPEPGKIPLAKGDGRIDEGWLPSAIARTSALTEISEKADLATATAEATESRTARYLAPAAVAPGQRDDGLPLQTGDIYFNTADQTEYRYENGGWRSNDSTKAVELINERFSVDPAAGKTPVADGDGRLGSGWIPVSLLLSLSGYDDLRSYTGDASSIQLTSNGVDGLFALSDSGLDNGGTTIVDANGRAWNRVYSGEINVRWFGAKLDGVTDDTMAVNAATAFCSANGGGTVLVPTGNCRIGSGGIKVKSNVLIKGCGSDNTFLQVTGSPSTVCVDFSLFAADFNYGGVENLTIRNSGLCLAGIKTPSEDAGFARAQRWYFDRIHFRGSDMLTFIEIGDCVQATLTNSQIRAGYKATQVDTGQNQTTGVRLTGVRGNVGCRADGLMIIGTRVGFHATGSAEGYFFQNTEVVGSWIGALVDSDPSKPGGFIDSIHFNCSYRCVDLQRRRAANVGNIQCYREYTYFKHGLGWSGVSIDDSAQINIGTIMVRIGPSFPDIADIAALRCVAARKVSVGQILSTEPSTMGLALKSTDSVGISIGAIVAENIPTWAEILGTSSNIEIGSVIDIGTQSTKPLIFGAGTSRQNVRAPIPTGVRNYAETTYASASEVNLSPRVNPPASRINLNLGPGAYVVNVNLQGTHAVNGDDFSFRLNVAANSIATINFIDAATGVNRRQVTSTASAQVRILKFLYNGGGWILNEDLTSL